MSPSGNSLSSGGDVVVVAGRHSRLFCIEPFTGRVLWEASVGDAYGTALVSEDCVLYLDQKGVLSCFELLDGSVRWSTESEPFGGHFSAVGSCVVVGGWRGYSSLKGRDIETGHLLWHRTIDGSGFKALHWPAEHDGGLLVSARNSFDLDLVDPRSGHTRRSWSLGAPIESEDLEHAFARTEVGSSVFSIGADGIAELENGELRQLWSSPDQACTRLPMKHASTLWVPRSRSVDIVNLSRSTVNTIKFTEGVAPGFAPNDQAVAVATRDGNILSIGADGTTHASLRLANRAAALTPMTDELFIVLTRGQLVGVQHQDN